MVLDHFEIRDWDLLMIGDGSGLGWDIGCGWANAVIDKLTLGRKMVWGGLSTGTVAISELLPYVHGLSWFEDNYGERRRQTKGGPLTIHVITDNEGVARAGNRLTSRTHLAPWWAAWDVLIRRGYRATFHHAHRSTVALNSVCDHVSRYCRILIQEMSLGDTAPSFKDKTVYDFNP